MPQYKSGINLDTTFINISNKQMKYMNHFYENNRGEHV
jgi:hypothetical protein